MCLSVQVAMGGLMTTSEVEVDRPVAAGVGSSKHSHSHSSAPETRKRRLSRCSSPPCRHIVCSLFSKTFFLLLIYLLSLTSLEPGLGREVPSALRVVYLTARPLRHLSETKRFIGSPLLSFPAGPLFCNKVKSANKIDVATSGAEASIHPRFSKF